MNPKAKAIAIGRATIHALQLGARVAEERAAQIEKWGVQRLPWVSEFAGHRTYETAARSYKNATDDAMSHPNLSLSWDFVLLEEVFEALEELEKGDLEAASAELVQVMAVAAAIVEHIDEETGR